jgi:arylsulfatase A-like enzyme
MSPPPGDSTPAPTSGARPPNIITIILDCARAKNFKTSDGDRVARTPFIDSLAARGTAFPRAVAPANWTVPSHFSFFTGSYPNVHGIRTFRRGMQLPESTATHLKRAGYETTMFSEMVHLVGGYGMEEGFELLRARHIGISDE